MNRTLTAAVALATGLGMAGLAYGQSSVGPQTQPNTVAPSMPSTQMAPPATSSTPPSALQNPQSPASMQPGGTQSPQANAQPPQMNQSGGQASQSEVLQAQQQLKSQGLYRGEVDGIKGPQTAKAISEFQKEQGLPQTAQLDQQTLDRLNNQSPGAGGMQNPGTTPNPTGMRNPTGASPSSAMPGNR